MSSSEQITPEIHLDSLKEIREVVQEGPGIRKVEVVRTDIVTDATPIELKARVIKGSEYVEAHTRKDAAVLERLYKNGNTHVPAFVSNENGILEEEYVRGVQMNNIDFKAAGIYTTAKILELYLEAVKSFSNEKISMVDANEYNFKIETDNTGKPVNAVCIDLGTATTIREYDLNSHYNEALDVLTTSIIPKESLSFVRDIKSFYGCSQEEAETLASIIEEHNEPWESKLGRLKKLSASGKINPIEQIDTVDTILISEKDLNEKIIPNL